MDGSFPWQPILLSWGTRTKENMAASRTKPQLRLDAPLSAVHRFHGSRDWEGTPPPCLWPVLLLCSALRNADLRLAVTSIQTLRKTHIPMKYTQGLIRARRANLFSSSEKQAQAIPVSPDRQGPDISGISFTIQVFVDQMVNPTVPPPRVVSYSLTRS